MKRLALLILSILLVAPAVLRAQGNHEYAPVQQKNVNYQNWTFKNLQGDKSVSLRSLMQGKKLVMVLYFAPWCPNWHNEAPVAAGLYEKFKSQGFEIIGVGEYATRDEVKAFFGPSGPPYPVVIESESREDRDKTSHYSYRQLTGDTRKWGSPYNIFLDPAKCNSSGDLLAENAFVVNGELIEAEADKFIHDHLVANKVIVPCKQ